MCSFYFIYVPKLHYPTGTTKHLFGHFYLARPRPAEHSSISLVPDQFVPVLPTLMVIFTTNNQQIWDQAAHSHNLCLQPLIIQHGTGSLCRQTQWGIMKGPSDFTIITPSWPFRKLRDTLVCHHNHAIFILGLKTWNVYPRFNSEDGKLTPTTMIITLKLPMFHWPSKSNNPTLKTVSDL